MYAFRANQQSVVRVSIGDLELVPDIGMFTEFAILDGLFEIVGVSGVMPFSKCQSELLLFTAQRKKVLRGILDRAHAAILAQR